ncbi:unnamed protein product [Vitrella brassicaformis CCMP3155]|uniref:Ammonium transporter n=2 Tax=Vitrella brassicaformis TaxID=1169539 RepID=A0A0G4EFZ7_VITBC|nr:unnamed protein product [Vitrella brassicaformis CCMP3155]|mmetsp:Transcript_4881/g.11338  ORF Transcript_4881/g.11338 Transcript_4881/m.11338 type:complete len:523 (+) Transcript_4881:75-1643(+)|eukprot:CEL95446.1 unnamed protein product [Vitrella brassicaformis CCMP3155]
MRSLAALLALFGLFAVARAATYIMDTECTKEDFDAGTLPAGCKNWEGANDRDCTEADFAEDPTTCTWKASNAQEVNALIEELTFSIDSAWIVMSGALVFFMGAGFAMLEAGSVRAKNASNILAKNLMDKSISVIVWWIWGYGLAFGADGGGFLGTSLFGGASAEYDHDLDAGSLHFRDWFFQFAFCSAGATIVSGAVAERARLEAYATFCVIMIGLIYPIIVHWTWGGGWLSTFGFSDFAGSGIVHMTGGVAAWFGAWLCGPRTGRYSETEDPYEFYPHNIPFVGLGALILWFGWYGFNCGSTLAISGAGIAQAARVAQNTTISAGAAGGIAFILKSYFAKGFKFDVTGLANGFLAGLVGITAGCADVETWAAFVIGLVAGCIYVGASKLNDLLHVDDPLEASCVHGACGAWGCFALGLLHNGSGLFTMGQGGLLGAQVVGILAIAAWSGGLACLTFGAIKMMGWLRISKEIEEEGMDLDEHGGPAYNWVGMSPGGSPRMSPRAHMAAEKDMMDGKQDGVQV